MEYIYCPMNNRCSESNYGSHLECITDYEACKLYQEAQNERIRKDISRIEKDKYNTLQYWQRDK